MKTNLTIEWYEIEDGIEVLKSKSGQYNSAKSAIAHAAEIESREPGKFNFHIENVDTLPNKSTQP